MALKKIIRPLLAAREGAVMVEFSLIVGLLLTVTCGMVDFSLALYQWNAASKAVELGTRLAAVSDPVSSNIATLSPTAAFNIVCNGATSSCSGGTYVATAMKTLVYGRNKTACDYTVAQGQMAAMCDIFSSITPNNVKVTYQQSAYAASGLGFAGRKAGPVPTITVEVTGMTFNFFFLNQLLGLAPMSMPSMRSTITGEDLSISGS